jgi:zinc-ribbon domain
MRNHMYCPQCANENVDAAKFCRVCGADLELVALAIAGNWRRSSRLARTVRNKKFPPEKKPLPATIEESTSAAIPAWLEKQRAGTRQIVQGTVFLVVSAKIGFISYLTISGPEFPWYLFWVIFFGWLAGWGAISLAFGLSKAIEAKLALRQLGSQAKKIASDLIATGSGPAPELLSVTEHTTRQLQEKRS